MSNLIKANNNLSNTEGGSEIFSVECCNIRNSR